MYADFATYSLLCTVCGFIVFSGVAGAAAGLAITMFLLFAGLLVLEVGRLIVRSVQRHGQSPGRAFKAHSSQSSFEL
jgi:uncharacterized membrane protein YtjA (UPF0391 family)